jgi:hypothetical protein
MSRRSWRSPLVELVCFHPRTCPKRRRRGAAISGPPPICGVPNLATEDKGRYRGTNRRPRGRGADVYRSYHHLYPPRGWGSQRMTLLSPLSILGAPRPGARGHVGHSGNNLVDGIVMMSDGFTRRRDGTSSVSSIRCFIGVWLLLYFLFIFDMVCKRVSHHFVSI